MDDVTPDDLAAMEIERRYPHGSPTRLIANALEDAWAEIAEDKGYIEHLTGLANASYERAERAEAKVAEYWQIMKHGHCSTVIEERDVAQAALDRVRTLRDEWSSYGQGTSVRTLLDKLGAALEGDQ